MDEPREEAMESASDPTRIADAQSHLDAAEAADDQTRLKVLEDLYRSLETTLEGSGNPSQG